MQGIMRKATMRATIRNFFSVIERSMLSPIMIMHKKAFAAAPILAISTTP